jgi:hypothetical protein
MMKLKTTLTKKDIVVVLVCLTFLLINAVAISNEGRRRAKRAVCLTNLRQLTIAWTQFTDDNDGKLVNGAAGIYRPDDPPWVGRFWIDEPKAAIKSGALWPYCQELKLYRCPFGYPGSFITYAIVDSMNGMARSGTLEEPSVYIENMTEIAKSHNRTVFIDQKWVTPDSYAVHYIEEKWWEDPPIQHNNGVTLSFSDGHGEYWKWKGAETIEIATTPGYNVAPETADGKEDLHRLQIAVWGKLGYIP